MFRITCLLVLLQFSAVAAHANWPPKKPRDYQWPWDAQWQAIPEVYSSYSTVVMLDVHKLAYSRAWKHRVLGKWPMRHETRLMRYHFSDTKGIRSFMEQPITAGLRDTIRCVDARVIQADGSVVDHTAANFNILLEEHHHYARYRQRVFLPDLGLTPGDQLELIIVIDRPGLNDIHQAPIRGPYPILQKELRYVDEDEALVEFATFNGFPVPEVQTVTGGQETIWRFSNLPSQKDAPFALGNLDQPFYTITANYGLKAGSLIETYEHGYPDQVFTARPHTQSFTRFVERRMAQLRTSDPLSIIRDVNRFIHDSITMVPSEELIPNEPVGYYFHDRRIDSHKLHLLYRSLFRILEVPQLLCFVKDRYSVTSATDTLSTHEFDQVLLAFRSTEGELHLIAVNDINERYLVDEIPFNLAGQPALLRPYLENKLKVMVDQITLPAMNHTENLLSEQYHVHFADGSWSTVSGRGTLLGQLRTSGNPVQVHDRKVARDSTWTLPDPMMRHVTIDSIRLYHEPAPRTVYHFTALPPVVSASNGTDSVFTVGLHRMIAPPLLGPALEDIGSTTLFPYPYHMRYHVTLSFPMDVRLLDDEEPYSLENGTGTIQVHAEQRDPRNILWRLDHRLASTWSTDPERAEHRALLTELSRGELYTLKILVE